MTHLWRVVGGERGERGERGDVVHLWLSKAAACERLACSDRTLVRKVKRGEVERRQIGRCASYRILTDPGPGKRATLATQSAPRLAPVARTASERGAWTAGEPTVRDVHAAIERLSARVGELDRKAPGEVGRPAAAECSPTESRLEVPPPLLRWAAEVGARANLDPGALLIRALRVGLEELDAAFPERESQFDVPWCQAVEDEYASW